jgi:subtilisin family serine protease
MGHLELRLLVVGIVGIFSSISQASSNRLSAEQSAALATKVDPWVVKTGANGATTEAIVLMTNQADLTGAARLSSKTEKGAHVFQKLTEAARSQRPLLSLLESLGVEHRSFWIVNGVWVRTNLKTFATIATRSDVAHVYANPEVPLARPSGENVAPDSPNSIEWNVSQVHAPDVWAQGFTGQGVVLAGGDTGVQWNHPALIGHYRGWDGAVADHNYNWHDAIHSGGGACGPDSPFPCDDYFIAHGTHTMGTMVGDDGGSNQVGVAPGAQWIACRNMDQGNGTPARYTECFEFFIAPTDLSGQNPDPTKAPNAINNSWGCPTSEGCVDPTVLQSVVENTRAAGIVVVVSAGNAGSGCSSVNDVPAIYQASFSVGATDRNDNIAGFSSRGPVLFDGSGRMKPDISAPGVGVRSSLRTNTYGSLDGTSMAGPHVVGVIGLILSAAPDLIGNTDCLQWLLEATAVPRTTTQTCGGIGGDQIPNNTYGYGRVDALQALALVDYCRG